MILKKFIPKQGGTSFESSTPIWLLSKANTECSDSTGKV